ncbi:MAG: hypothetical protein N2Z74_01825 [Syntrophales bacterium]|nr:hypothetical protein [Syntrophales bacterium]
MAILLLVASFGPGKAEEPEWELIMETPEMEVYLDLVSLVRQDDHRYLVRCRIVAKSPRRREFIMALREEEGLPVAPYRQYLYSESTEEIDCAAVTYRTVAVADYNMDAVRIGTPKTDGRWRPIFPSSYAAALARWLCDEPLDEE